tara:strand:+ start:184 stop:930 length:747 start_codon:yes stop_codon:yes gene_type:complete
MGGRTSLMVLDRMRSLEWMTRCSGVAPGQSIDARRFSGRSGWLPWFADRSGDECAVSPIFNLVAGSDFEQVLRHQLTPDSRAPTRTCVGRPEPPCRRHENSSRLHVLNPELVLVARAILARTKAGESRRRQLPQQRQEPSAFDPSEQPSMGFLAVLYALGSCDRVSIYGMSRGVAAANQSRSEPVRDPAHRGDAATEQLFYKQLSNVQHSLYHFPSGPLVRLLYRASRVSYQLESGGMQKGLIRRYNA